MTGFDRIANVVEEIMAGAAGKQVLGKITADMAGKTGVKIVADQIREFRTPNRGTAELHRLPILV
jgi:hypothetical protein